MSWRNMQSIASPEVLIVGSGVTGLLLAQALKKNGISASVVEEEDPAGFLRSREWGMSIQWALPMLNEILPQSLHARLQSTSVDPHYFFPEAGTTMPVYNADDGQLLKAVPIVHMIRVSRRKFRTFLTEGIDIQYLKRVKSITISGENARPTAVFEDGATRTVDLIIGADGAKSSVRQSVFKDEQGLAQKIPYAGINMHVCYGDAETAKLIRQSFDSVFALGVHPKGYWLWLSIQEVPDPADPKNWTFQLQWTWKISPENKHLEALDLSELKTVAASFAEPFRSAWTKIPDGTRVPANRISVWQPQVLTDPNFKGKVALIGDAAHAMSFQRGQGLNHGIADVLKLSGVLCAAKNGEKSLGDAVQEYEAEMVRRAGEEVAIGNMNTALMHDWDKLMESPFMVRGGDKNK